ncbi:MAG: hypothetical protein SP1CHLAM54_09200 [Chlamydiia bacterium]|nr:hypothetical protein [Chlamydiia bacterium]MCH9615826.1 hypothetical protein [Chlamydiia bacterium]MCH9628771.1 hypothetical protein [Chlamydiia bacterium]
MANTPTQVTAPLYGGHATPVNFGKRTDRCMCSYIEAMLVMLSDNSKIDKFKIKKLAEEALLEGILKECSSTLGHLSPTELVAFLTKLSKLSFLTPDARASFLNAINDFNQNAQAAKGKDPSYIDECIAWNKSGITPGTSSSNASAAPGAIPGLNQWSKAEDSMENSHQTAAIFAFILNFMRACGWPPSKLPSSDDLTEEENYQLSSVDGGDPHMSIYQFIINMLSSFMQPSSTAKSLYGGWIQALKAEAIKLGIKYITPDHAAKAEIIPLKNATKSFANDLKAATEVVNAIGQINGPTSQNA